MLGGSWTGERKKVLEREPEGLGAEEAGGGPPGLTAPPLPSGPLSSLRPHSPPTAAVSPAPG